MAMNPNLLPQQTQPVFPMQQQVVPQQQIVQPQMGQPSQAVTVADQFNAMQQFYSPQQPVPAQQTQLPAQDAQVQEVSPVFYLRGNGGESPQQQFAVQQQQNFQQPQVQPPAPVNQPIQQQPLVQPGVQQQQFPGFQQQPQDQFQHLAPQQQTLDYNQLLNSIQNGNQNTDGGANNEIIEILKNQQKTMELLASQRNTSGEPDYLNMDNQALANLIQGDEENKTGPQIREILQAVAKKASQDAIGDANQKYEQLNGIVQAVVKQNNTNQARQAIATLKQNFGNRDPYFNQNMMEVGKFLATPQGQTLIQGDATQAVQDAYFLIQARNLQNPQYQQALAQAQIQAQSGFQSQQLQKLQAGIAGTPVTQTPTPFPVQQQMQQQPNAPGGRTDSDVLKEILGVGSPYGVNSVIV